MTAPRLVIPSAFAVDAPANGDLPLVPRPSPGRDAVPFDLPGVLVGTAQMWWFTALVVTILMFVAIERGQFRTNRPKAILQRL